jgi:short subunit dehydrogenase-like uncharacterized protein
MTTIAVYGATGYTGRLVAAELERRGMTARLCGRNGDKLRALVRELGVDWETRAATLDDTPALLRALEGADVVINCAGPFTYYGAPVIEAALHAGASYLDTTGEQVYMQRVFDHFDAPAREQGVAVIPAVGFDYVPGDLVAALAARGREPVRQLDIGYAVSGFGMTRGTMHSALEMLGGGDLEYVGGDWRTSGRPPMRETFDFGGSLGKQLVARYPGGEIVTVPRHVDVQTIRERMAAASFAPHPRLAGTVAASTLALAAVLRTPLRGPLDALIDRLPEGPSVDDRRAARFTVVAEAHGTDGSTGRAVVRGSDVYGLTAVMAVEIARRVGDDGFSAAGALAPAQALDPEDFLGFLADHGVTYEVDDAARVGQSA